MYYLKMSPGNWVGGRMNICLGEAASDLFNKMSVGHCIAPQRKCLAQGLLAALVLFVHQCA